MDVAELHSCALDATKGVIAGAAPCQMRCRGRRSKGLPDVRRWGTAEAGGRQVNLLEAVMGLAAVPGRLWGTASHDGPGSAGRLRGRLARLKPGSDASGLQSIGPAR
jgi:hypothetical protein